LIEPAKILSSAQRGDYACTRVEISKGPSGGYALAFGDDRGVETRIQ
jgi:hypothetical protein